MADIMEILGEDRFRINSYRRVARIISDMPTDIEPLLESGQLAKIPGIGKSSLAKIEEFIKTGTITAHKQLLKKIPPTLLELLTIPGVGPKGVKAVYEKLNVTSIAELKDAIKSGSLAQLAGFGDKKAAAIAKGIEFREKSTGRIRLDQAQEAAELVGEFLKGLPGIQRIQPAGSLRRWAETIGDVDILVSAKTCCDSASARREGKPAAPGAQHGGQSIQAFTGARFIQEVLAAGPTKGSAIILLRSPLGQTETALVHVDVRVVPQESFGAAAQYFTGSKQHNVRLREIAIKAKLKLNEYGLFKGNKMIAGPVEKEIYEKLGLDYIDPLLREDRGEIDASKTHSLPELIQPKDIKGDLHIHTNASDGDCDTSEIAKAAKQAGYKYICITDHSRSSAIANGLSPKRLAQQIKKIRKLNEKLKGITILAGTEVDILADSSLDFDNKLLADLDFVIAAVHSGLASSREQ